MTPKASGQRATGSVGLDPIESASPEELRALQLERLRWSCSALSAHYLIEITRPERLDEMRIQVECRPGIATGSLARSQGKAKRVVDLRARGAL